MEIIKAKDFRVSWITIGVLNNTNVAIVQPEIIVPRARRFKELTKFLFSSLVGDSALNRGVVVKQNVIIRRE